MKSQLAISMCILFLFGSISGCVGNSDNEPQEERNTSNENSGITNMIICPDGTDGMLEWGVLTCAEPEVFRASDVSLETQILTLEWYDIAVAEWGNYGPVEIYIVGNDVDAASELEDEYCERHKALDSNWNEEWDCANANYQIFTQYVEEGGAAISTFKRTYLDYDFSMMTMSAKYPGPDEDDYKPVTLHEYFHIFQHAHISDECSGNTRDSCERNAKMGGKSKPWFSEGSAEYMAQTLYSQQPGVENDYLRNAMERKLMSSIQGYQEQDIALDELTYSSNVGTYDIGAWFIAYLIHNEGESALIDGFYGDLDELGFDGSFESNFNSTRDEYIAAFNSFLQQPTEDILSIIPVESEEQTNSASCAGNSSLSLTPGVTERTLVQEIDGDEVTRRYLIQVPQTVDESKCYPLLFALHGNGGEPDEFPNQYADMVNAGEFVGIYPAGIERSWNLGREASTANDTEFLESVADSLQVYENLDHDRRYVFGFSNGAGMAHTLGKESMYFSAFVAVITSLTTENIPTSTSGSPSVMQILGEDDELVPYEGGEGVAGHVFLSGDESARTWAEHNACDLNAENTTLDDGSIRTVYTGCIDGGEVVNYKVANAGHGINDDFEGGLNTLMWAFVSKHTP